MVSLLVAFMAVQVIAQDPSKGTEPPKYSVYEYVTCAVYFRMLIGALKINTNDLSTLEDVYKDQMNRTIQAGRQLARQEWGEEDADKEFDLEWKSVYGDMSDQIDKNFTKIRRLKMRYADRCDQMGKSTEKHIKLTAAPAITALLSSD